MFFYFLIFKYKLNADDAKIVVCGDFDNKVWIPDIFMEWVFFSGFMENESERSGSLDICLFFALIYSPWTPEKKTFIPYTYNPSNKDPF